MQNRALLVLVLAACGRYDFASVTEDATDEIDGEPAVTTCAVSAPFTTVRRLAELDVAAVDDGAIRLDESELVAFFHTNRNGSFQIFTATRGEIEQPFGAPVASLGGATGVYWPSLSADGLTLVYHQSADLAVSTRASKVAAFALGTKLSPINTSSVESSPLLGGSGTTMYFSRVDSSTAIYVAAWPNPTSAVLDASLETQEEESAPALSFDERVIYFARTLPSGAPDIWVAEREAIGASFLGARRVDELSTGASDLPTWLSVDRCRLYFESDRDGRYAPYIAERSVQGS